MWPECLTKPGGTGGELLFMQCFLCCLTLSKGQARTMPGLLQWLLVSQGTGGGEWRGGTKLGWNIVEMGWGQCSEHFKEAGARKGGLPHSRLKIQSQAKCRVLSHRSWCKATGTRFRDRQSRTAGTSIPNEIMGLENLLASSILPPHKHALDGQSKPLTYFHMLQMLNWYNFKMRRLMVLKLHSREH